MQRKFLRSNYWPTLCVTAALAFAFIPELTPKGDALASVKRARKHTQDLKTSDIPVLKYGVPIERQLAGTEQHNYSVALTKGQYVNVVALQKSIDVVLALYPPSGEKLSEVDNTGGPEVVFMVADVDGNYRLEVRASDKEARPGLYELRIADLREATAKDRSAVAAQKLFEEGGKLASQRTAESRRSAITKYEQAMPLWKEADQTPGQAIGGGYNSTLSSDTVTITPLPNGQSILINFKLGVQKTGTFRFYIIVEALP